MKAIFRKYDDGTYALVGFHNSIKEFVDGPGKNYGHKAEDLRSKVLTPDAFSGVYLRKDMISNFVDYPRLGSKE